MKFASLSNSERRDDPYLAASQALSSEYDRLAQSNWMSGTACSRQRPRWSSHLRSAFT
jgi:hypothetical protein